MDMASGTYLLLCSTICTTWRHSDTVTQRHMVTVTQWHSDEYDDIAVGIGGNTDMP